MLVPQFEKLRFSLTHYSIQNIIIKKTEFMAIADKLEHK